MMNKNYFVGLTFKLFIFFFLTGITSILLISSFSYFNTRRALLDRTFQQLTSVRVLKKRQVEIFFKDRINDIQYLSGTQNIVEIISMMNRDEQNQITEWPASKGLLKTSAHYSNIFVTNFKKCILLTEGEDNPYVISYIETNDSTFDINSLLKTKNELVNQSDIIIKDFYTQNKGNYVKKILVGAPIFKNNILSGLIAFYLDYEVLNNIMLELDNRSGLGESGESYLVGNDFIMRSSSRFHNGLSQNTIVNTVAVSNALRGNEGTGLITDYRGVEVLCSYGPLNIDGLHWVIIAEIDIQEAMIPIKNSRNKILLISFIIFVLLLPVSYLLSSKITHPIIKLNRAINLMSEGSLDIYVDNNNNDEIGSLTSSFNIMASKITKQTNELIEREERLQHFYDATKDGIILHNNGIPVLINQALCDLTFYSEPELMRMHIDGFLIAGKNIDKASIDNKIITYDGIIVKKDQSLLEVEVQETMIEYKEILIKAIVVRDISRRRKAEKALTEERSYRLSSMIDGQEMERQRLSRELHDSLGQSLIAVKLKLESIIDADFEKTKNTINEVKNLFDATIDEVRRISNNLMPAVLYEFGIQTALSNLCKRIEETASFKVDFYSNLTSDNEDSKIKTYLYRIAQEAMNNCVKHSKADLVKVYLLENAGKIKLIIKDNGKGFNFDKNYKNYGNGILNMRERAQIINAEIEIHSALNQGTEIIVEIPLK
ncbi:MAG: histidine kinase [Bacteroidales bacterium]|nr:histidine kinase [Bacteroidales bacterium]